MSALAGGAAAARSHAEPVAPPNPQKEARWVPSACTCFLEVTIFHTTTHSQTKHVANGVDVWGDAHVSPWPYASSPP